MILFISHSDPKVLTIIAVESEPITEILRYNKCCLPEEDKREKGDREWGRPLL